MTVILYLVLRMRLNLENLQEIEGRLSRVRTPGPPKRGLSTNRRETIGSRW